MMYKITIEQDLVHRRNNGETWTSTERIEGTANDFETVTTIMGVISEVFPNSTISVTTSNHEENEED